MNQTARPLLFNADESRRLGYIYRLVEAAVWLLATARQQHQIEKPKRSRKEG